MARQTSLDRGLTALSSLNFPELKHLMKELGRPEASAKNINILIEQLRASMQQDADRKITHVFKVLETLESMEHTDTTRIRALFLDGDLPLQEGSTLANKDEVTRASRVTLMNKVKDTLLFSGPDVYNSVIEALKSKQLNIEVGKIIMFTPDLETWHKGVLVSLLPLVVELDGEEVQALEVCLEETYFAAEIKRVFKAADANRDGILSYDELTRVMRAMGFVKSTAEMGKIFKAVDKDNSGFVDYEEFVDWVVHDPRSTEIENAEWIDGIHAHAADQPGQHVKLNLYGGYEMHGPGVVVLTTGNNFSDEIHEGMQLLAVSVDCIDDEVAPVLGVSFDVHGHDFKVGFATARNRFDKHAELDVGISFTQVRTPYETLNEIRVVDDGVASEHCYGHFKEGGRSTVHLELNEEGKVEMRHDNQLLFTSSREIDLPIFVKVFTSYDGALLQDLKWSAPRKKRRSTFRGPRRRTRVM